MSNTYHSFALKNREKAPGSVMIEILMADPYIPKPAVCYERIIR